MIQNAIHRLQEICDTIPPLLLAIDGDELSAKPSPDKWSKKQIIGHLIDSAANNHHRFVRGQFEDIPHIVYNPDDWNNHGYYCNIDSHQLITFWESYNRQLLALMQHIPPHLLSRRVDTNFASSDDNSLAPTIAYLIEDYVVHMEHHLRQIIPNL